MATLNAKIGQKRLDSGMYLKYVSTMMISPLKGEVRNGEETN